MLVTYSPSKSPLTENKPVASSSTFTLNAKVPHDDGGNATTYLRSAILHNKHNGTKKRVSQEEPTETSSLSAKPIAGQK